MSSSLQRTFTALPTTTVDIAIVPPAQIALSLPDANWLLGQAQDAYTIQILGTHSPKNLTRFIRSQGLDEGLAYYTIERKGKDWFVLVQGVYPDRATARLARAQLPEKVRANNPWIRRLDEVHELIRTATPADRMLAARSGDIENSLLK
jgi:septal ring-binding cell division protein DamX